MEPIAVLALVIACLSLILAAVAYWRAGGRSDIAILRARLSEEIDQFKSKQRALTEELSLRIRSGYEDSLSRIRRAQAQIVEIRKEVSSSVREGMDVLSRQLAQLKSEADAALEKLKTEVSGTAQATQQALARRVKRLEGRVQIYSARSEMTRAERLAAKREFHRAEELLEDAVAKVRETRNRLSDEFEEDPAFAEVIRALQDAITSVRSEAEDYKRQIEHVLSASDSLISSLASRDAHH
jgi:chromosome segregation ATPase